MTTRKEGPQSSLLMV